MKTLQYLDYKIITSEDRSKAEDDQKDNVSLTVDTEEAGTDNKEQSLELMKLREAKIEVTDRLLDKIFEACGNFDSL